MSGFFDYLLIDLLPFWQQFFLMTSSVAWPIALIVVARLFRPFISSIFSDRGFSFEGFGAQIKIEERKASQPEVSGLPGNEFSDPKVKLPRTLAIEEQEKKIRDVIEKIPSAEVIDIAINALAMEQLDKHFALTYIDIFGSQMVLLQRINERGSSIEFSEGEDFFNEVKSRYHEFSDWNVEQYLGFLTHRNLLHIDKTIQLTPFGKDFIHFVVRFGLRTDKAL